MTLKQLAIESGVSVNTIYDMTHGNPISIKFDDVKAFCDTLRITPNQLFNYSIEGWSEK